MNDEEEKEPCFEMFAKRLGVEYYEDRISFPKDMDQDLYFLVIFHHKEIVDLNEKIKSLEILNGEDLRQ